MSLAFLDISTSVQSLVTLIYALLPLIFIMMIIALLKRSGKKLTGLAPFIIGLGLLGLLFGTLIPGVSAATDASPGSTSTVMGMPVQQAFSGLVAGQDYDLVDTTGTNSTVTLTADSDGELTTWITPLEYGANSYVFQHATDHDLASALYEFQIDNMDVIPFLMPVIMLSIVLMIVGGIKKGL